MSIEAALEKLTLGDEPNLVEEVKKNGIEKSGLAAGISALAAKAESEDETEALAGLALVKALAEGAPDAQAATNSCLAACLQQAGHKSKDVKTAATDAALAICANINPFALKSLLPAIFSKLPVEVKWPIRELALSCLATFGESCPKQLGNALPEVVPEITACMWDTKKQVKVAATTAMREGLKVIGNKDIEYMTEKILTAITKPKEVPEIMHEMAGVTFVQSVECPALAMVVPLLLRGLREKSIATKRQSAVIINNMSKLVDNPLDAAPFLPLLLPALETNAISIADPEARGVTEKAVEQLMRLQGLADKAVSVRGDTSKVSAEFKKAFGAEDATGGLEMTIDLASSIATTMMDISFMEDSQWKKNLSPIFASYYDAAKSEESIEKVRVEAEKMMDIPEEDDDDDDAEVLCNCQFTLAYGTKILLHNTKMKLLRGKKYGLLGGNDSGKTTLMRSISKNQVEGFPDSSTVRTVFVEADIQGEQSHLSCIDYVFVDEKIQELGCTKEQVREMLSTVGFVPD